MSTPQLDKGDTTLESFPYGTYAQKSEHNEQEHTRQQACSAAHLVLLYVPWGHNSHGELILDVGKKELPGTYGSTDNESLRHVPIWSMSSSST